MRIRQRRRHGARGQPSRWASHLLPEPVGDHRRPPRRSSAPNRFPDRATPGPTPSPPTSSPSAARSYALGDGSLAYELTTDLETLRRVDLAGGSRGLAPHPKLDPSTGELHLLALNASGTQSHVVIPPAAMTRTRRPIDDAPDGVRDLAVSREHVVVVTDGFIGVMPRTGEPQLRWIVTGSADPTCCTRRTRATRSSCTPSVPRSSGGRCTRRRPLSIGRCSIRHAPRFGCIDERLVAVSRRYVWTGRRERRTPARPRHRRAARATSSEPDRQPGELVFVADPLAPPTRTAAGSSASSTTDAPQQGRPRRPRRRTPSTARPSPPSRIPRRIPYGLHATWIPTTPLKGHRTMHTDHRHRAADPPPSSANASPSSA